MWIVSHNGCYLVNGVTGAEFCCNTIDKQITFQSNECAAKTIIYETKSLEELKERFRFLVLHMARHCRDKGEVFISIGCDEITDYITREFMEEEEEEKSSQVTKSTNPCKTGRLYDLIHPDKDARVRHPDLGFAEWRFPRSPIEMRRTLFMPDRCTPFLADDIVLFDDQWQLLD